MCRFRLSLLQHSPARLIWTIRSGFGGIGISTPIFDPGDWNSVAVQPSGKIVLAGRSGHFVAVVRLNSTGSLDTEFNGDGKHAFRYATGDE